MDHARHEVPLADVAHEPDGGGAGAGRGQGEGGAQQAAEGEQGGGGGRGHHGHYWGRARTFTSYFCILDI